MYLEDMYSGKDVGYNIPALGFKSMELSSGSLS